MNGPWIETNTDGPPEEPNCVTCGGLSHAELERYEPGLFPIFYFDSEHPENVYCWRCVEIRDAEPTPLEFLLEAA